MGLIDEGGGAGAGEPNIQVSLRGDVPVTLLFRTASLTVMWSELDQCVHACVYPSSWHMGWGGGGDGSAVIGMQEWGLWACMKKCYGRVTHLQKSVVSIGLTLGEFSQTEHTRGTTTQNKN